MALQNFRDIEASGRDLNAGFQWEFYCAACDRRWNSPYRPYRRGQFNAMLTRFASLLRGSPDRPESRELADLGTRRARDTALAQAQELAAERYRECPECRQAVCGDCIDSQRGTCLTCAQHQRAEVAKSVGGRSSAARPTALACPNCQQPHAGGRFCAACGFDMAGTHKSCPGCGALVTRAARFCTDCGHAF